MIQFIIISAFVIAFLMDKKARYYKKRSTQQYTYSNEEDHWKFVAIRLAQVIIIVLATVVIPPLLYNN